MSQKLGTLTLDFSLELGRARTKLAQCVRGAREASRDSWQETEHGAEFRRISREALADARYWRAKVREFER